MLPTFVIIGAQKSASSFMRDCLADHPDIFLPPRETPLFESPEYENGGIDKLESLLRGRAERCVGIKRPSYLGKAEIPDRLRTHLPNGKLIAVLRNPVDRAVSAYFHYIRGGFLPPLNVEVGMRKLLFEPSFCAKYKRAYEVIEFGFYYKYLSLYNEYMINNQVLVFLHEDIFAKPLVSIQTAYDFLGVNKDFIPRSLNSHPQKVIYNLKRLELLRLRNRFMCSYNRDRTRSFARKMNVLEKFYVRGITLFDRMVLSLLMPNDKPRISPELRNLLYGVYASDIESLERFVNRDLSAWKLPPVNVK